MLTVAFYDPISDSVVDVEPFPEGIQVARMASLELTMIWSTNDHSLPGPYWVAWDHKKGIFSLFVLDQTLTPDEATCEHIRSMVSKL